MAQVDEASLDDQEQSKDEFEEIFLLEDRWLHMWLNMGDCESVSKYHSRLS